MTEIDNEIVDLVVIKRNFDDEYPFSLEFFKISVLNDPLAKGDERKVFEDRLRKIGEIAEFIEKKFNLKLEQKRRTEIHRSHQWIYVAFYEIINAKGYVQIAYTLSHRAYAIIDSKQ